jgi:hypothetical protein
MIFIYKGQTNLCPFTLDEATTSLSYDVLFEFINVTTGVTKTFTQTEIIDSKRTNNFYITESSTEQLYHGTVSLEAGQWTYTVYEMPLASPNSITKASNVGILEIGRVTVYDYTSDVTELGNDTKDNPTFE